MANKYLRSAASGSANGSDWTNAYTTLSALKTGLSRGDTGYVAAGSYAGATLNTATSSTTTITIKRATVADHGTGTGWSDAFDGQATFSAQWDFTTGYWVVDGKTGVGDGTVTPYGFKINFAQGTTGVALGDNISNVSISYVEAYSSSSFGDVNYSASAVCLYMDCTASTISHCYFHGGDSLIYSDGASGNIIEYCHLQASRSSNPSFHSNVIFITNSTGGTFRYNTVYNFNDEGIFFTGFTGVVSGWRVYGNTITSLGGPSEPSNPRGIELRQDYSYSDILIYNNTFVDLGVGGILNRAPENGNSTTGCAAVNNLGYLAANTLSDFAVQATNTADSTDRFVDLAGSDFHLLSSLSGTDLPSPYNMDMDGNMRGTGGSFDRGAFQFETGTNNIVFSGTLTVTTLSIG